MDKNYKRELSIPKTLDEKSRTIRATIATSIPADIYDYTKGEIVSESLMVDGVELYEGLKCPLIDSHEPMSTIKNILGTVQNIKAEGEELTADIVFASTEEGERAFQLAKDGHLRKLSVGYQVTDALYISENEKYSHKGKEYQGPAKISLKWTLFEVSTVAIPADVQCNFKSKNVDIINTNENNSIENNNVIKETNKMDIDKKEVELTAIKAERARVKAIREAVQLAGLEAKVSDELVDGESTIDQARAVILEKVAEERSKNTHTFNINTGVSTTKNESIELAFRASCGFKLSEKEHEELDNSRIKSAGVLDLAKSICEKNNIDTRYMSANSIADKVLNDRYVSSDFSNVLSNIANKQAAIVFTTADVTYPVFTKSVDLADFKQTSIVGLQPISYASVVSEGAVPTSATIADKGETIQLSKLHSTATLSYEALINDDLGVFIDIPNQLASQMAFSVERGVYSYFIGNPALSDSVALFTSASNFKQASGGTITVAGLDAAFASMISAKVNGRYLNLSPKVIVVPPSQYATASGIVGSNVLQGNTTADTLTYTNNNYKGLKVVTNGLLTDSSITGYSSTAWYCFADPINSGIVVGRLRGNETPVVTSRLSVAGEAFGIVFDAKYFYGVKAGNRAACYKNAGA